jgi:phosphoserine phosphatase RsbX
MEGMIVNAAFGAGLIEWGVSARPLTGEIRSGDSHLVAPFANGVLVAVVDGLGHGAEAADAARIAILSLQDRPQDSVIDLLQRSHLALKRTRGVVLSLASIDAVAHQMTWIGVGNVDGSLLRADRRARPGREALTARSGVVGYQLPPLRTATLPIAPEDVLIFATDGISSGFHGEALLGRNPQDAADHILKQYAKATDDALALVARYAGAAP